MSCTLAFVQALMSVQVIGSDKFKDNQSILATVPQPSVNTKKRDNLKIYISFWKYVKMCCLYKKLLYVKTKWIHLFAFLSFFFMGNTSLLLWEINFFKTGSTCKRKHLLKGELLPSFKDWRQLKREKNKIMQY